MSTDATTSIRAGRERIWITKAEKQAIDARCSHLNVTFRYVFKVYSPHISIGDCQDCLYEVYKPIHTEEPWRATAEQWIVDDDR